jgi:hypothetical protein
MLSLFRLARGYRAGCHREKNMTEPSKDAGVIQVLAERLEKLRLPTALALKEKVDKGEPLNQFDIAFLEEVFEDATRIKPLLDEHPEWQDLAARMTHLYHEITTKALANEKGS